MKHPVSGLWTTVVLVMFASVALGQSVPSPFVKEIPATTPMRMLFLGNSLMYYSGGLQTHLHRMAAAGAPPLLLEPGFKSVHITGAGLDQYPIDFLVTPGNLGKKEPFQMVVLTGNSQDATSEARRALYRRKVIEFDAVIKKHGGRTALLWLPETVKPHPSANQDLFHMNQEMMLSVGNEVRALILPVGLAYHEAYRQRPDIQLQVYDGNHPTVAGQYLAAAVLYASIYGKSPLGNSYDYFGTLDQETKTFVQKVADETVRKFYGR